MGTGGGYFDLLFGGYALNIFIVLIGVVCGYAIKNYLVILGGLTFILVVYLTAFLSSYEQDFFYSLFVALYLVILCAASVANLFRKYTDWVLER